MYSKKKELLKTSNMAVNSKIVLDIQIDALLKYDIIIHCMAL